jgi:hypothetical protein
MCGAASLWAKDPPLDPWADAQWRGALSGLKASEVRSVRWSEQLFEAASGAEPAVTSSQVRRFMFADDGRLAALGSERARRGERDERRQLNYQRDPTGQLQRIDEEGAAQPLLQRQADGPAASCCNLSGAARRRSAPPFSTTRRARARAGGRRGQGDGPRARTPQLSPERRAEIHRHRHQRRPDAHGHIRPIGSAGEDQLARAAGSASRRSAIQLC